MQGLYVTSLLLKTASHYLVSGDWQEPLFYT